MFLRLLSICLCLVSIINSFSQELYINELMAKNNGSIIDKYGESSDWIELYNASSEEINLEGYALQDKSAKKWFFPAVTIKSDSFLFVFASGRSNSNLTELHADFKIKSEGEKLTLYHLDGSVLDMVETSKMSSDESEGRSIDGGSEWVSFRRASAGVSNDNSIIRGSISFSHESGFYSDPFNLTVTGTDSVYYTLDGSEPTVNSFLYSSPIEIRDPTENLISQINTAPFPYSQENWKTIQFGFREPQGLMKQAQVLRVRSFKNKRPSTKIYNKTYFMRDENLSFDVVSLITDRDNLFSNDSGIYVPGENSNDSNLKWTGNYDMRGVEWERPALFQYFKEGDLTTETDLGLRISGAKSRSNPQKSLRLYFRDEYGDSFLKDKVFPERNVEEFKRLVLRSAFTYWNGRNAIFQDEYIHALAHQEGLDLDLMLSKPTIVFINGEYWGIHNIRERQDERYINYLYGIAPDSLDIIDGNTAKADVGSGESFSELREYILTNDLSLDENYDYVSSKIDISNYIDYFVFQTFFGNVDWPWNNIKMWRSHRENAKWRYLMYDLDATMANYSFQDPFEHMNVIPDNGQVLIFQGLMANHEFKTQFFTTYMERLKTSLSVKTSTELLFRFKERYAPAISEHVYRWQNPTSYDRWERDIEELAFFLENRPCQIKDVLISNFDTRILDDFDCTYTDFDKDSENLSFTFPNPVSDFLRVTVSDDSLYDSEIHIVNSYGKELFSSLITKQNQRIDVSQMSPGAYFIRVDGIEKAQKLIKF